MLDNVPLQALWYFGWGMARHFVTALNIGTMGYWWWHVPVDADVYYEEIEDLEKKLNVRVARSPSLRVDWGQNRVLTEEDLARTSAAFLALPSANDTQAHGPYNFYIGGLTFLSLNDLHWQCESTVFGNFFECMKGMFAAADDSRLKNGIVQGLLEFLDEMFPNFDERAQFEKLFVAFDQGVTNSATVTLKEASFINYFATAIS